MPTALGDLGPRPAILSPLPRYPFVSLLPGEETDRRVYVLGERGPGPLIPNPFSLDNLPPKAKRYVEGVFNGEVDEPGQAKLREEIVEGGLSLFGPKKIFKAVLTLLGSEQPTGRGADPVQPDPPGPNAGPSRPGWTSAITQALARVHDELKRYSGARAQQLLAQLVFLDALAAALPPDP